MPPHTTSDATSSDATSLWIRPQGARYLAISQRKFDQLVASGLIPRVKIGSSVRFDKGDLDAFVEQQKQR